MQITRHLRVFPYQFSVESEKLQYWTLESWNVVASASNQGEYFVSTACVLQSSYMMPEEKHFMDSPIMMLLQDIGQMCCIMLTRIPLPAMCNKCFTCYFVAM